MGNTDDEFEKFLKESMRLDQKRRLNPELQTDIRQDWDTVPPGMDFDRSGLDSIVDIVLDVNVNDKNRYMTRDSQTSRSTHYHL